MTISGTSEVVGYAYRWSLAKAPDQRTPYVLTLTNLKKFMRTVDQNLDVKSRTIVEKKQDDLKEFLKYLF
jgi:hypothetical protein